jgi:MazG family protein
VQASVAATDTQDFATMEIPGSARPIVGNTVEPDPILARIDDSGRDNWAFGRIDAGSWLPCYGRTVTQDETHGLVPGAVPLEQQRGDTFASLVRTMQRLLAPDGCPWDREQTPATLRKYVLEEACEVIDAIDGGDPAELCDELGDLSLQVAFLAELSRQSGQFGPDDVMRSIVEKLVRRHPHVFGDTIVEDSDAVVANWNRIKVREKGERRLLDGLPRSLPALLRAQRIGERVQNVGFDWPSSKESYAKVTEEIGELSEAVQSGNDRQIEAELGDLLLAIVNYARHLGIDAETALRKSVDRFDSRFRYVEDQVRKLRGGWPVEGEPKLELTELDRFWEEAKQLEEQT